MGDLGKDQNSKVSVISGRGATVLLLGHESGSVCLLDAATGVSYTLPIAALVGDYWDFVVSTSVTSNNHKVITPTGTFLQGGIGLAISGGAPSTYFANGTSNTTFTMNGTTTGGLIGTSFRLTKITATKWNVTGVIAGSGTVATPIS